jgi:hypothetical protein
VSPQAVRRLAFTVAVTVQLAVLYAPRVPATGAEGVPHLDKLGHLAVFAAVVWTGARAGVPLRWLLTGMGVHALGSEWLQHLALSQRAGDPTDVVANLAGTALGAWGAVRAHGARSGKHGAYGHGDAHGVPARRDPGAG